VSIAGLDRDTVAHLDDLDNFEKDHQQQIAVHEGGVWWGWAGRQGTHQLRLERRATS